MYTEPVSNSKLDFDLEYAVAVVAPNLFPVPVPSLSALSPFPSLSLSLSMCVLFGRFELVLNVTDRIDFYFYVLVRGLKKFE